MEDSRLCSDQSSTVLIELRACALALVHGDISPKNILISPGGKRTAELLPALLLARVDGESPVEYLTTDSQKTLVREVAFALLQLPETRVASVKAAWRRRLEQ